MGQVKRMWIKRTVRMGATLLTAAVMGTVLPGGLTQAAETKPKILKPQEDYTNYNGPSVDQEGCLHLTNNSTISDVSVRKLRLKQFSFEIPGAWVGQVVVRVLYLDQTLSTDLYKSRTQDSYVIRFYEKNTWNKYHSGENAPAGKAASMGELAELRIMNRSKNDTSRWSSDPMYLSFASVQGGQTAYDLYLYRPKRTEGLTDPDFASASGYLSDIDYKGCLVSSFRCQSDLKLTYRNSYISKTLVDGFDPNGEGMEDGSTIPEGYVPKGLEAAKNQTDQAPAALNRLTGNGPSSGYAWQDFAAPWTYPDRQMDSDSRQVQSLPDSASEAVSLPDQAESQEDSLSQPTEPADPVGGTPTPSVSPALPELGGASDPAQDNEGGGQTGTGDPTEGSPSEADDANKNLPAPAGDKNGGA